MSAEALSFVPHQETFVPEKHFAKETAKTIAGAALIGLGVYMIIDGWNKHSLAEVVVGAVAIWAGSKLLRRSRS